MSNFSELFTTKSYQSAIKRFQDKKKIIERSRRVIATGHAVRKLDSKRRIEQYAERELQLQNRSGRTQIQTTKISDIGLERSIGTSKDILSIEFLEAGVLASGSVGYVEVMSGSQQGTGFLIGNSILMTNHHVLPDLRHARSGSVEFDREFNQYGSRKKPEQFELLPDRFYFSNKELDYALVAVSEHSFGAKELSDYGYHPLIKHQGKVRIGDPVNIIQHPAGKMKSIVVHNSNLLHLENNSDYENYLWYSSDTESGSSGSPVFNNRWEVVGLHHRAIPKLDKLGRVFSKSGGRIRAEELGERKNEIWWIANEGIRASSLVNSIENAALDQTQSAIRDELIALWNRSKAGSFGLESKRQPGSASELSQAASQQSRTIVLGADSRQKIRIELSVLEYQEDE